MFSEISLLEWIAFVLGVISVWFIVKRNVLAFPIGIVMVCIYAWIFYHAKLYSDMILQGVFVVMQIQGWLIWSQSKKGEDEKITVLRMNAAQWGFSALFVIGATFGVGYAMQTYTDASLPYIDAFTTMVSLTAQWWMNKKYLENWVLWVGVDLVYLYQYGNKALYATVALYAIFTIMAAIGLKEWWEIYKKQEERKTSWIK